MTWDELMQNLRGDTDKTFKPTVEWMAEKYQEMNNALFNGQLGGCSFDIFTKGRGSQGGVLGWFKITSRCKVDRYSRRMCKESFAGRVYIDRDNFVDYCQPKIELNGNYSGTEYAFLATLVHEMCHYYTYMYGYCPKQGHGREFKEIGAIVSQRSKGLFTIQRLASAEQMSNMELSDEMKAKREKRLTNKKSKIYALLVYFPNGDIQLTTTSNQDLIQDIVNTHKRRGNITRIFLSNDEALIDTLFAKGYRINMKSWRYWHVGDKWWARAAYKDLEGDLLYNDWSESQTLNNQTERTQQQTPQEQQPTNQPKRIFSIKTSKGNFEFDASNESELRRALKERFPYVSDEIITKIMNNPSNYKIVENKTNIKQIIESVINEFMRNEFRGANNNEEDMVEITPNMNLGLHSPLENEDFF